MTVIQRNFRKRNAILTCLQSTDTHPSADWVFTQLKDEYPDISLGTVYRNLALFKKQGIIASVGNVGGFERFDGNPLPHIHFICETCGSIIDLTEISIPESLQEQAATLSGADIRYCNVSFFGICAKCKRKNAEDSAS